MAFMINIIIVLFLVIIRSSNVALQGLHAPSNSIPSLNNANYATDAEHVFYSMYFVFFIKV